MKKILFYDTETTSLPNWKIPSDDPSQPHIVQIAAVLCEEETGKIISSIDLVIKPDGWTISDETIAIHGITEEFANEVGVNEGFAVMILHQMADGADRAAYNKTFDQRIVRIASKRFLADELVERWAIKDDHHDPMRMFQKCFGGKNVKLAEAYEKIAGHELQGAHNAMADTLAAKAIYYALRDRPELTN